MKFSGGTKPFKFGWVFLINYAELPTLRTAGFHYFIVTLTRITIALIKIFFELT